MEKYVLLCLWENVMDIRYAKMLKWFKHNHPKYLDRWIESISPNQIICKRWLVDTLKTVRIPRGQYDKFTVEIIGAWYGFPLIQFLIEEYGEQIRSFYIFETDDFCKTAIWKYFMFFGYDTSKLKFHGDYFKPKESDYKDGKKRRSHLVINTSCEHMPDMESKLRACYEYPERTLVALQSNDKTDEKDHINCVNSCQELAIKNGLREILGDRKVMKADEENYYNRFMVMGKWKSS